MREKSRSSQHAVPVPSAPSFDGQADSFSARAGLPIEACRQVVSAIVELACPAPDDVVLDVGAGTGELGQMFAEHPLHYLGMDRSRLMLAQFRRERVAHGVTVCLVQADANVRWPLVDASIRIIFASRSLHLFTSPFLLSEILRVARGSGALLLVGRVQRDDWTVKSVLRRELHSLLRQHGFQGREGRQVHSEAFSTVMARGGRLCERRVAAVWTTIDTPEASLRSWAGKAGLGGLNLPEDVKEEILSALRRRAVTLYDDLMMPVPATSRYVLEGVWLPERTISGNACFGTLGMGG